MLAEALSRGEVIIQFAYLLIGVAVFIIARMLLQEQETREAQDNLESSKAASNSFIQLIRPFYRQYLVPTVRGKPAWEKKRTMYRRMVVSAGLADEFTGDEFIAFKMSMLAVVPIGYGMLAALGILPADSTNAVLAGLAGYWMPDFWVKGKITSRQKSVLRAMPFVVDLLALSVEAGLDFVGAIQKVVEKASPSPLIQELAQLLKEMEVGSSRQESLREMSLRLNLPEMNSFVAILISADKMGAPIGKILRQQSEQIRVNRLVRAEKAGARASQLITIPTILCIVPAVILMIFGPYIVSAFTGGSASGGGLF